MKTRTYQSALNAGELSQKLRGRKDVARYANGLEECRNALPMVGGGVTRRAGSLHVANAAADEVLLFPFVIALDGVLVGYLLEFSAGVIRVCDSNRQQITDGGNPVEIVTPYAAADLERIQYEMNENSMHLWHPDHPEQKLTRVDDTTWTLAAVVHLHKPYFRPADTDAITITPSAVSGNVTLTASADLFVAGHVGVKFTVNGGVFQITSITDAQNAEATTVERILVSNNLLQIEQETTLTIVKSALTGPETISIEYKTARTGTGDSLLLETEQDIPADSPGLTFSVAQTVDQSDGQEIYYDVVTIQIDDALLPGDTAVVISGTGRQINTGPAGAVAFTVEETITPAVAPAGITYSNVETQTPVTGLEPDTDWQVETWNAVYGYPLGGTFHEQRKIVAGTVSQPTAVWGSKIGESREFEIGTLDDEAFGYVLAAAQSGIRHLATGERLAVFTGLRELAVFGSGQGTLTPTTPQIDHQTSRGSNLKVRPIMLGKDLYFAGKSGMKLFSMRYQLEIDGQATPDIGRLAEHLLTDGAGIVDMAYSVDPEPTIWLVTAAGNLLSLTVDQDEGVVAWAKHHTAEVLPEAAGGDETTRFKSVAVLPGPDEVDQIWIAVQRTIDGNDQTMIEVFTPGLNTDSAVQATNTDTVSVAHLEGQTVDIVADGYVLPQQVVAGGQVVLDDLYSAIEVGLHYRSRIKDLPPYIEGGVSAAASMNEVSVLMHKTKAAAINSTTLDFRAFPDNMLDTALQEFSGWKRLNVCAGWDYDQSTMQTTITQDLPLPWTILAIAKEVTINDG